MSFFFSFCLLGMYPAGFNYMAPPPPYPGPPQNWAAPPQNGIATAPAPPGLFPPHFLSISLYFPSLYVCVSAPVRSDLSCLVLNHFESRHQKKKGADVSSTTHQNCKR